MTGNETPPAVDPGQGKPPTRAASERRAPVPMITRRGAALKLYRAMDAWYRIEKNREEYERSTA